MNITQVNLNLLLAFDALMREGNVTRAARRLGVTQSAMSSSLKQLRALFDDPLFIRQSHGIAPTERARELAAPIRDGLALLESALAPTEFDAARSRRSFTLAASDYMEFVMLPPLLARLREIAPGIRLDVRPWGLHEPPPALEDGSADLMLGYTDGLSGRHQEQVLFEEEYVCVVRRGHPRVKERLTLAAYVALDHVVVSQTGRDGVASVDRALAQRGLERRVGARVSHFLMVPRLIAETDMVAALSKRVAVALARAFPIRTLKPPLPLPSGRPSQVWHARTDGDAAHVWLREQVAAVATRV